MEALFLRVLNMSITGSYVILAVIILRLFLKKAPKKYSYMLWAVCAFRLCCPVSFKNIFSIFNLRFFDMNASRGAAIEYIPQSIGMMDKSAVTTGLNSVDGMVNGSLPAATPLMSANPMQILMLAAAVIWLAGIAALLLYGIAAYIMLRVKLRDSVLYKGNVFQSDKIGSPFVFGLIDPKIYIPFNIGENETDYVLSHERYHIKRRDHIIKPAAFLILILHWFNPFCWLAFALMSFDMEMSCDEGVLSNGGIGSKEYSASLLSFAAGKRPLSPCPLAFGETGIKGRVKNILKYKKPKAYVSAISVILCVAAAVACVSNPNGNSIGYNALKMSPEAYSAFCKENIGAIMADIDYADAEKIVFHYNDAFFVYNHRTATLEKSFDLNKLDCARFQQGDYGVDLIVSADGKEALLVNYGTSDDSESFKNYIIKLEKGSAAETDKTELSDPFSAISETAGNVPGANAWTSVHCASENGNIWYLTCDGAFVGGIRLCLYKAGKTVWEDYIFESMAQARQDRIYEALPKGAEIVVNSGMNWDIEIDTEYYHSREFEGIISSMDLEDIPNAGYNPNDFRIDDFMRAMGVSTTQYEDKRLTAIMYDVKLTADNEAHQYLFVFDSGDKLLSSIDLKARGDGETVKRIFIEIAARREGLQAQ